MRPSKYKDNSIAPIVAMDFDGTICMGDSYPDPFKGVIRPYVKEVMNYLYDVGIVVIIWTCRESDDISEMKRWLDTQGIKYLCINTSYRHAPFHYESRKVHAHKYVDDRAFGWVDHNNVMIEVLSNILSDLLGAEESMIYWICSSIKLGRKFYNENRELFTHDVRELVQKW